MKRISEIATKAIDLIEQHGEKFKAEGLPGHAQSLEVENFKIIYTTPFSGAEVYPGQRTYMIDIWYNGQKVLSECYQNYEGLKALGKSKRAAWVEDFFELTM